MGHLRAQVYTGKPTVIDGVIQNFDSLNLEKLYDVSQLPKLLSSVEFFNARLRIMGIQDSYLPWSRANPLNGKPIVAGLSAAWPAQVCFDDGLFDKDDDKGAYIFAVHVGDRAELQGGSKQVLEARFSADAPHCGHAGNEPLLHRAVFLGKGECALRDPDYFVTRVARALQRCAPRKRSRSRSRHAEEKASKQAGSRCSDLEGGTG